MKKRQMKKNFKKIVAKVRDRADPKYDAEDKLNNILCKGFLVYKEIKLRENSSLVQSSFD